MFTGLASPPGREGGGAGEGGGREKSPHPSKKTTDSSPPLENSRGPNNETHPGISHLVSGLYPLAGLLGGLLTRNKSRKTTFRDSRPANNSTQITTLSFLGQKIRPKEKGKLIPNPLTFLETPTPKPRRADDNSSRHNANPVSPHTDSLSRARRAYFHDT